MKMKAQKSVLSMRNFKNLMSTLIPTAKKGDNKINQIKSRTMHKIWPNKDKILQKGYLIGE